MPRTARKQDEIDEVKDSILDGALAIIVEEGYASFTMRKLGSSLGCAAKTIYNYFNSKEEIYLRLLIKGFEKLNSAADEAICGVADPLERLRILGNTYIQFGLENGHYYNIMFSWDVPKYLSYVGTNYEVQAWEEKEIAMYYASVAEAAISEALLAKGVTDKAETEYRLIRMWAELHGFISLNNSLSFREYHPDTLQFRDRIVREMLADLQ